MTVILPLDTAVIVIIPITTSIISQYSLCWGFRIRVKAIKKTFQFIFGTHSVHGFIGLLLRGWRGGGGQVLACHCRGVIA